MSSSCPSSSLSHNSPRSPASHVPCWCTVSFLCCRQRYLHPAARQRPPRHQKTNTPKTCGASIPPPTYAWTCWASCTRPPCPPKEHSRPVTSLQVCCTSLWLHIAHQSIHWRLVCGFAGGTVIHHRTRLPSIAAQGVSVTDIEESGEIPLPSAHVPGPASARGRALSPLNIRPSQLGSVIVTCVGVLLRK